MESNANVGTVRKDENFDFENVRFEFGATIDKAWQDEETGKMHVRAIASDDQLDLQRDRMSGRALGRMADMAKSGVPLLDNHRATFEFGKTVHGQVIQGQAEDGRPVSQLLVELELDADWPQARKLFKEIAGGECARQLSIGGKLNLKNREAVTVQMTGGGLSRTINDLELDHIATTRKAQAANPRTSFVEAVAKALDSAEEAGWEWQQEPLAKSDSPGQNTPLSSMDPMDSSDIKLGAQILASVGKASRSSNVTKMDMDMNGGETPGATPEGIETTPGEPATPEMTEEKGCEDDMMKAKDGNGQKADGVADPKTLPEQAQLKPEAKKYGYAKTQMLGEISAMLSKMEMPPELMGDDETPAPEDEEMKTLREIHGRLQKMIQGADLGSGEKPSSEELAGHGAGAYEQDTSAAKPGYSPDKAPAGDSTNVAGTNVTGHENNIQVGGEIPSTAPTAKAEYAHTMGWLRQDGLVKSLGEANTHVLEKALGSAVDVAVEKGLVLTKDVVVAAVEKVLEEQHSSSQVVHKAIENFGATLNDMQRRLAIAESNAAEVAQLKNKVARVEKSGGVSQSQPRGGSDAAMPRPGAKEGGVWTGLFNKPVAEATATY